MNRLMGLTTLMLFGGIVAAQARPPTATISPGYDRRLQESRRERGAAQPVIVAPRVVAPRARHRHRKLYRRY